MTFLQVGLALEVPLLRVSDAHEHNQPGPLRDNPKSIATWHAIMVASLEAG